MNAYLASVIENVKKKYANEPEFVQCVEEVLTSLEPVIDTLTMETHHGKHHATYTATLNTLAEKAGVQNMEITDLLANLDKIADLDTRNTGCTDMHAHRDDDLVGSRNALRHTLSGILVMRHMSTTQSFDRH